MDLNQRRAREDVLPQLAPRGVGTGVERGADGISPGEAAEMAPPRLGIGALSERRARVFFHLGSGSSVGFEPHSFIKKKFWFLAGWLIQHDTAPTSAFL